MYGIDKAVYLGSRNLQLYNLQYCCGVNKESGVHTFKRLQVSINKSSITLV